MKNVLPLALALSSLPLAAFSAEPAAEAPAAAPAPAPAPASAPSAAAQVPRKHLLEVTFGTSQAFNGKPQQLLSADSRVLPTAAASLIVEWLAGERWSVAGLFNLPLGPTRVVRDGVETWAVADAVAAAGLRWSPLYLPLPGPGGAFEAQVGALLGCTINSPQGVAAVPVLTGRLHVFNEFGFTAYVGVSWAFVAESFVLTYGIGNRF
ncbi:MAG: hypothetical protein RL653_1841 [Pseudomonadota bacterium]|jgi:hypothetical protein